MKTKHRVRRNVKKAAPQTQGGVVGNITNISITGSSAAAHEIFGQLVSVDPTNNERNNVGMTAGSPVHKPVGAVGVKVNGVAVTVTAVNQNDYGFNILVEAGSFVATDTIDITIAPFSIILSGGNAGVCAGVTTRLIAEA